MHTQALADQLHATNTSFLILSSYGGRRFFYVADGAMYTVETQDK